MHHPYFQFTSGAAPTPPVVEAPTTRPSGGHPWLGPYKERREFFFRGIPEEVSEVIQEVAKKQVEDLEMPKRIQALALQRELKLRSIAYETRFFEALAREREALIELEIGQRLRAKLLEDDIILWAAIAASV